MRYPHVKLVDLTSLWAGKILTPKRRIAAKRYWIGLGRPARRGANPSVSGHCSVGSRRRPTQGLGQPINGGLGHRSPFPSPESSEWTKLKLLLFSPPSWFKSQAFKSMALEIFGSLV